MLSLAHFRWTRHPDNPVVPPNPDNSYDCTCCMDPFVMRMGDEYWLYYAGVGTATVPLP